MGMAILSHNVHVEITIMSSNYQIFYYSLGSTHGTLHI